MGGAQPLAGAMANACLLAVEVDEAKIDKRLQVGYLQKKSYDIDEALNIIKENIKGIGPFRWIALSGEKDDIYKIDNYILQAFKDNHIITNWIKLAGNIPFEGLTARIGWLGHGER